MPDTLLKETANGAVLLTLNAPHKRNALSSELMHALRREVAVAMSDDTTTAVVLTGAPPAFCAGLDLDELPAGRRTAVTPDVFYELLHDIYTATKPIVAAVNGDAVAGGAALMGVCDFVIAARSTRVGYPQIRRGLTAPVVMPLLIRQVGERRAKRLLLTGELLPAEEARSFGLIDDVVDDNAVLQQALSRATQITSSPSECFAETKWLVREVQAPTARALFDRCKDLDRRHL